MSTRRGTGWKVSSQRRSRPGAMSNGGGIMGSGVRRSMGLSPVNGGIANPDNLSQSHQYAQQLNPYKTSLMGSGATLGGGSGTGIGKNTNSITITTTSRNTSMTGLMMNSNSSGARGKFKKSSDKITDTPIEDEKKHPDDDDDDDDDLGLDDDVDNILSSITEDGGTKVPPGAAKNEVPDFDAKDSIGKIANNSRIGAAVNLAGGGRINSSPLSRDKESGAVTASPKMGGLSGGSVRDQKKMDGFGMSSIMANKNASDSSHLVHLQQHQHYQGGMSTKPFGQRISIAEIGNGKGPRREDHHVRKMKVGITEEDVDDDIYNDDDDDTLLSDGDATRQHKLMVQSGKGPMFSSGGFDDSAMRPPQMSNSQIMPAMSGSSYRLDGGSKEDRSVIDSIVEESEHDFQDINLSKKSEVTFNSANQKLSSVELDKSQNESAAMQRSAHSPAAITSPQDPLSSPPQNQLSSPPPASIASSPNEQNLRPLPESMVNSGNTSNAYIPGAVLEKATRNHDKGKKNDSRSPSLPSSSLMAPTPNNRGEVRHYKNIQEEETVSTVTDPTESPFIYTYKKPGDDDSVSQITSSITGSSSHLNHVSSYLQNIPTSIGGSGNSGISSRNHLGSGGTSSSNGLSWMGGSASAGSRINHRKGGFVVPGTFGRDRGRQPSVNSSSSPFGGSDIGGGGVLDCAENDVSHDVGNTSLDEIAFALNADHKSGRNQRACGHLQSPGHSIGGSMCSADDASNMDSLSISLTRHRRSLPDYSDGSIASGIISGGASCSVPSLSGNTSVSDSTDSPARGLFQSLSMMAWKAQHRAGRFFFPTSVAVTRRKKYDRSDSLDDILSEEGANSLPHRKRGGRYDEEDNDIDYFGKVMGSSNSVQGTGTRITKQRDERSWASTARLGGAFSVMTIALTMYRMSSDPSFDSIIIRPNQAGPDVTIRSRLLPRSLQGKDSSGGVKTGNVDSPGQNKKNNKFFFPDESADSSRNLLSNQRGNQKIAISQQMKQAQPTQNDRRNSNSNSLSSVEKAPEPVTSKVTLPPAFEALSNVDTLPFQKGIDVPFYWHVPRSGGGTVNDILGSCFQLTLAADAGGSDGHDQDQTLEILKFSRQVSYVNVDTSSRQGIIRAKQLNLVSSGMADVVISPLLHDAASLFTPSRRGKMFTIIRDPIERAASLFYFIQDTQWKQPSTRNDQFADISIEDFYRGGFAENNWMTRFLTNELTKGELTDDDLNIAKEVLRQKCLVGLLEEKGETFDRIQKYFGWNPQTSLEQECLEKKLQWSWPMKHRHASVQEGSDAYYLVRAQNQFDLQLYKYAIELFHQQANLSPL